MKRGVKELLKPAIPSHLKLFFCIKLCYFCKMILVTGATGFVGSHLLYFLLKEGKMVRALYRTEAKQKYVKRVFTYFTDDADLFNRIEWFQADVTDIPALNEAFKNIAEVYHTAAYVTFNPKHFNKLKKSTVEGTANVVAFCLKNKVKKLCHISSVASLGKLNNQITTEENPWNPDEENSVYSISKYAAEMEVWRGTQEGLNAVIVNPGVILGSGYWHSGTGRIFSKAAKGMTFYSTGTTGFVDVIDVAKASILLMENNKINERFILVSENSSYQELLAKTAIAFGKKPPFLELKSWMLQLGWRLDFLKSRITGTRQNLFKSTAKSLVSKSQYSNEKIVKEMGYTFIPIQETIERTVKDFLKNK